MGGGEASCLFLVWEKIFCVLHLRSRFCLINESEFVGLIFKRGCRQCDQIGQIFRYLGAPLNSLWQQCLGQILKRVDVFHFSSKTSFCNFWATLNRHWATF